MEDVQITKTRLYEDGDKRSVIYPETSVDQVVGLPEYIAGDEKVAEAINKRIDDLISDGTAIHDNIDKAIANTRQDLEYKIQQNGIEDRQYTDDELASAKVETLQSANQYTDNQIREKITQIGAVTPEMVETAVENGVIEVSGKIPYYADNSDQNAIRDFVLNGSRLKFSSNNMSIDNEVMITSTSYFYQLSFGGWIRFSVVTDVKITNYEDFYNWFRRTHVSDRARCIPASGARVVLTENSNKVYLCIISGAYIPAGEESLYAVGQVVTFIKE